MKRSGKSRVLQKGGEQNWMHAFLLMNTNKSTFPRMHGCQKFCKEYF